VNPADPKAALNAELVRDRDRDRYLATLYSPAAVRPALFALHALDLELAQAVATTTEAMLGEIRLAWWREALAKLDTAPPPAQPVLAALAAHALPLGVRGQALEPLEDAFLSLLLDERLGGAALDAHLDRRGGTLFGACATALGVAQPSARALGRVWALGQLVRPGRVPVIDAADALRIAGEAFPARLAPPLRPLAALAGFAVTDVRAVFGGRRGPVRAGVAGGVRRQARLLWRVASGR
jgi:phytoene synthase